MRCRRLFAALPIALVACFGLAIPPATAAIGTQVPLTQITEWGGTGTGGGLFNGTSDIAVDPSTGNVYVADVGNTRIQRFTPDGAFLGSFNRMGPPLRGPVLQHPIALAIGGGNVYVQDDVLGIVARFSLTGAFLNKWVVPPQASPPSGSFSRHDIAADAAGNVYVLTGSSTVQKYSPAGALVLSVETSTGYNMGLAVAANGDILVTGLGGGINRFSAAGAFVSGFDASPSFATVSLAVDAGGNVWTSDILVHKILSFTPSGDPRASAGTGPGTPLFTTGPGAVAASTTPDTMYVLENNRVVKIGKAARLILTYDSDGSTSADRTFTVSGPGATQTFLVDDDTDPTLPNTAVASALALGIWHIDLTNFPDMVKNITCDNGVATIDYLAHAIDITLGVGQTVSCHFYAEWIG